MYKLTVSDMGGHIFDSNTQSKQKEDLNYKPAEKSFWYQIKSN